MGLLSACAPEPPARATTAPAQAPTQVAAAPTSAPAAKPTTAAAPTTAAPAKPAATPVPAPAQATAAQPAAAKPAAKSGELPIGRQLVGKLEGPTLVLDPAQFPKTFKEAPQLAELVKAGKLPPVQERIGQDPLVIKPLHETGTYGGVLRRGFTGPGDRYNGIRLAAHDHVLYFDYTMNELTPNVARDWKISDDGKVTTISLRRGMRWSDGHPLTADDFVFWYEDMHLNKELNPTPPNDLSIGGEMGKVEKVDDLTVRYTFSAPYFLYPEVIAGNWASASHSNYGRIASGGFGPAHYLKQFHPKYASKDELDRRVAEAQVDNWVLLLKLKNTWESNADLPVITPWKTVTPINTPQWVLERNPYFYGVDTDGNQLPYIDRVVMTLGENLEVINLRAISGEFDMQARHIDMQKLPALLENRQKGDYSIRLDPGDFGSSAQIRVNMSYEADPEIARLFESVEFRRALALGIDRDQINEAIFLGLGTPSSVVPADDNMYSPGPEYRTLWATSDVAQANQLLDKVGLTQKDSEGLRQRTDGKGRLRLDMMTWGGQFVPYTQIAEMVRQQWRRIGIDVVVQETERSLGERRNANNETQLFMWDNGGTERLFGTPGNTFAAEPNSSYGPLYGQWFTTNGARGKEPPPRMKEMMEKWRRGFGVPQPERIALGKEIWKIMAEEVWAIGLIGLSPAVSGIRVVKNKLRNVPEREIFSNDGMTPGITRPESYYWKA
ncbi:MAG: ABC transporter substrate-binding protein [Chloroflexi bacterium]|nr:ABC transporter substrate-binding protein [Chloroflexota bacterium]